MQKLHLVGDQQHRLLSQGTHDTFLQPKQDEFGASYLTQPLIKLQNGNKIYKYKISDHKQIKISSIAA
jgi:hypothetical protein